MFEPLESRRMMSVSGFQSGGAPAEGGWIEIEGTSGPDVIQATRVGNELIIDINGVDQSYLSADVNVVVIRGRGGNDLIDVSGPGIVQGFNLFGDGGHDIIYGSNNDDLIHGGGEYLVSTSFLVEGASDELHGGAGDDSIYASYRGLNTHIYGDAGDDYILGSMGADTLYGGDGEDRILGLGNDDWIQGGNDDDSIHGGPGNDWIFGQEGNDELTGGAGNDLLFGGNGNDVLFGSDGNDSLFGEAGDDKLFGEFGVDVLDGGTGDDVETV